MKENLELIDNLGLLIERLETVIYFRNLVYEEIMRNREASEIEERAVNIFRDDSLSEGFLLEAETNILEDLRKVVFG